MVWGISSPFATKLWKSASVATSKRYVTTMSSVTVAFSTVSVGCVSLIWVPSAGDKGRGAEMFAATAIAALPCKLSGVVGKGSSSGLQEEAAPRSAARTMCASGCRGMRATLARGVRVRWIPAARNLSRVREGAGEVSRSRFFTRSGSARKRRMKPTEPIAGPPSKNRASKKHAGKISKGNSASKFVEKFARVFKINPSSKRSSDADGMASRGSSPNISRITVWNRVWYFFEWQVSFCKEK